MPTNKNAAIRYQTLDKCFRDRRHRYYMEDLIDKCEEAIYYYNGVGGVSRRQIFEDIKFMESETGWSVPLERKQDGRRVYYRYRDPDFTINAQPLTEDEARQLRSVIITLRRFRGLPSNAWVDEVISNLEWRFGLRGKQENMIGFEQNPYLRGLNLLPDIIDAATSHQAVRITYATIKIAMRSTLLLCILGTSSNTTTDGSLWRMMPRLTEYQTMPSTEYRTSMLRKMWHTYQIKRSILNTTSMMCSV